MTSMETYGLMYEMIHLKKEKNLKNLFLDLVGNKSKRATFEEK